MNLVFQYVDETSKYTGSQTESSPQDSTLEGHDPLSQTTTPFQFSTEDFSRAPIARRKPEPIVSEEESTLILRSAFVSKIEA